MNERLILWTQASDVFGGSGRSPLTDAQFAELKRRGVDGLVAQTGYINAQNTNTPAFAFTDPNGAQRADAAGIDVYLGYYSTDYSYPNNPFVTGWHIDDRWAKVATYMRNFAAWAMDHGCMGVAQDSEPYRGGTGVYPSWYNTPAPSGYTVDTYRQLVQARGGQLMAALTAGFPGLEVITYYGDFPGSYQQAGRRAQGAASYTAEVFLYRDFWKGCLLAGGYGFWEFWESWFYKSKQNNALTWDQAVQQHIDLFNVYWASQGVDMTRIGTTSMNWVNGGLAGDPPAMDVPTAAAALSAGRQGFKSIGVYCRPSVLGSAANDLDQPFDWRPYVPAMQAASGVPTVPPDITPPDTTLQLTAKTSSATFEFAANEQQSTFEGRLDGGGWMPVTTPKTYSGLTDGMHTFEVRATDTAGNVDQTPAAVSFTTGGVPQVQYDAVEAQRDAALDRIAAAKTGLQGILQ